MKTRGSLVIIFLVIAVIISGCTFADEGNNSKKSVDATVVDYNGEFVEANHEEITSAGYDNYVPKNVHLEGTISWVDSIRVHIKDSDGNRWLTGDFYHDFSKYEGQKINCYCLAEGVNSSYDYVVDISFSGNPDYRIEFEDGTVFSRYDNCTMHDLIGEERVAFGGIGENNTREYHIIDVTEKKVRYIKYINEQWYYIDGEYSGFVFHRAEVKYNDKFSEVLEITPNNSLVYFINRGEGIITPSVDANVVQDMIDTLISGNAATVINEDNTELLFSISKDEETSTSGLNEGMGELVWIPTNGGTMYHFKSSCSGMKNPKQVTLEYAIKNGFVACQKCH